MAPSSTKVIAFDLFGTLLSTASIAQHLSQHFGPDLAQSIAAEWRKQQLEYTWRLNSMGKYENFSAVTKGSLDHALALHSLSLTVDETVNLLDKYKELSTFDDVIEALDFVSASDSVRPLIFTNGTEDMVQKALSSPSLSAHAKLFRSIVSVEQLNPKVYKPHPAVYQHLAKSTGKEDRLDEVWVVTANPFDVVGARAVGLQAAWVDRERRGWQDKCLGDDFRPSITGANLKELVEVIATI